MTLASVTKAARRYRRALEQVEAAAADLHVAILEARRQGAKLREIADAADLSLQRVHQIVGPRRD